MWFEVVRLIQRWFGRWFGGRFELVRAGSQVLWFRLVRWLVRWLVRVGSVVKIERSDLIFKKSFFHHSISTFNNRTCNRKIEGFILIKKLLNKKILFYFCISFCLNFCAEFKNILFVAWQGLLKKLENSSKVLGNFE